MRQGNDILRDSSMTKSAVYEGHKWRIGIKGLESTPYAQLVIGSGVDDFEYVFILYMHVHFLSCFVEIIYLKIIHMECYRNVMF